MKQQKSNSPKQKQPDVDALALKLRSLLQPAAHDIPEGFKPIAYWSSRLGVDESNAYAMLREGESKGVVRMQRFRRTQGLKATKHWKEV